MWEHNGLQYFIVDRKGERMSVPIKASSIYTAPTSKNIEKKFGANAGKKAASLPYTSASVRSELQKANSLDGFYRRLYAKNIVVIRFGEGILFIDHRNKLIASAQELGIDSKLLQANGERQSMQHSFDTVLLQKLLSNEYAGPDLNAAFLKKKRKKKR
jgi:hypothetical protein